MFIFSARNIFVMISSERVLKWERFVLFFCELHEVCCIFEIWLLLFSDRQKNLIAFLLVCPSFCVSPIKTKTHSAKNYRFFELAKYALSKSLPFSTNRRSGVHYQNCWGYNLSISLGQAGNYRNLGLTRLDRDEMFIAAGWNEKRQDAELGKCILDPRVSVVGSFYLTNWPQFSFVYNLIDHRNDVIKIQTTSFCKIKNTFYFKPTSTLKRTTQKFAKAVIVQYSTNFRYMTLEFLNPSETIFRKSLAIIPTFSWRKRNFPNEQLTQFILGVNLPLFLCSIEILWLLVLKDKCWYSKPKLATHSSYIAKI